VNRPVRRLLILLAASLLLLAAACGNGSGTAAPSRSPKLDTGSHIPGVTVSGQEGSEPTVHIKPPLKVGSPVTQVVDAGSGNPVVAGQPALVHLYLANGTTGKKVATTYDSGVPTQVMMSQGQFFAPLVKALVGKPQGSRIAFADTVKDIYGAAGAKQVHLKPSDTLLFVVDVVSVQPTHVAKGPSGAPQRVPAGLPSVVQKNGDVTNLDFSKAASKPPGRLRVVPLVKGNGPPARDDSFVTFDYFGEVYGAKKPFDESYTKQPVTFPLGIGQLIQAWDKGLVGVRQGSRVMIVAPADVAYGPQGNPQGGIPKNATLVFVVDVLGVDG
jgi:peptidylprolyl isomerase